MKVEDFLKTQYRARDGLGSDIAQDRAIEIAEEMRTMLEVIYRYNCVCSSEEILAAWEYLNGMERDAWKRCVEARGRYVD